MLEVIRDVWIKAAKRHYCEVTLLPINPGELHRCQVCTDKFNGQIWNWRMSNVGAWIHDRYSSDLVDCDNSISGDSLLSAAIDEFGSLESVIAAMQSEDTTPS